jgi:hypothetical protein
MNLTDLYESHLIKIFWLQNRVTEFNSMLYPALLISDQWIGLAQWIGPTVCQRHLTTSSTDSLTTFVILITA